MYNYLVFSYTASPFLTWLCHSGNRSGGLTETPEWEFVCIGDLGARRCRVLLSSWPSVVVAMLYLLGIGCDQLFGSILFLSTLRYQGEVDPMALLCVCHCSLSFA